jgi:hypothetical protein
MKRWIKGKSMGNSTGVDAGYLVRRGGRAGEYGNWYVTSLMGWVRENKGPALIVIGFLRIMSKDQQHTDNNNGGIVSLTSTPLSTLSSSSSTL